MSPLQTVLIVDDDRLNRAALAELLKDECRLLLAKDGPMAIEIAAREDVSLVLLDVSMPGMDGYEVLRRLKAEPATADMSVIFITGMAEQEDEERGLLLGAADYVQKPIRPAIVKARVAVHLKLAAQRRQLERLSQEDGLTGIANRRYFDEALDKAVRHARRQGRALGVAMLDVDHFKQYNDFYGHGAGDDALRQVADVLKNYTRRSGELAARYGGEEFVLLVPEAENFANMLDRVRLALIDRNIPHALSPTGNVLTLSGGAVFMAGTVSLSALDLLHRADELLYQAKRAGRNRISVETLS